MVQIVDLSAFVKRIATRVADNLEKHTDIPAAIESFAANMNNIYESEPADFIFSLSYQSHPSKIHFLFVVIENAEVLLQKKRS